MRYNEVVFRPNQTTILRIIMDILFGIFIIILGLFVYIKIPLFGIIIILISLRISFYQIIDLFFIKKIYIHENKIILKILFIKIKLDKHMSFTCVESYFVPASSYAQPSVLVIKRNPKNFIFRLFKNTVKLNIITSNNKIIMEELAEELFDKFEIKYIGAR